MYNTKNKTQKAYKKNKPNLNLIPKNCVCVFPIEIVGGKTQVSNLGIMPNRRYYDKGSFLYWQEVFDGRSALKLQWVDSITLEKPEGKNYYLAKQQVGSYYYGKPISNGTEQLEISDDASFEDFMSMKASQSITLRFEYTPTNRIESKESIESYFHFELVDNDIYNLYMIPELCENKLMYISEHQEYYDDLTGESKGCEITFSTLGDKIQKSGKAIEQYCSWNAPGEFAVIPQVVEYYDEETEETNKYVIYNYNAFYDPTPIKYLQVEQQGPALTSTIYAIGRKQEWDEENGCWKVGPSKILLPYQFATTQPNPLNRTATPTKNFFCFPDEQVTLITDNAVLEWLFNKATQPLEQVKNAGMISIGSNWKTETEVAIDNNSNPVGTDGIRKDYFDKNWYPLSYDGASLGPHDTSGSVYATDTMSFTATDTMIDIMCKNAFIYNSQPIIPLSFYSTRPYYLRDIPIIGAIANFFKCGDIKIGSNTTSRKATSLCFFGDADIMTMCANLNGSMGTVFKTGARVFPINFFGTNEGMYQKLGVNAANTTFCMALTDQIQLDGTTWDTIYLGQSKYEDGSELFPSTHQSLLVNSTLKPVQPTDYNFIIDAVVVQSIFDGKIRISCYGPDETNFIYPQWTATILSNANWENGNMRDWTNIFMLSNWEERFCVQEDPFTWPEAPHKIQEGNYTWTIDATDDWQYQYDTSNPKTWQDTDNVNFPWPNMSLDLQPLPVPIGPFEKVGKYSSQLDKILYTGNVSYTDLGVEGVTDKDTFIEHFGYASLNADDSFVSLTNCKTGTVVGSDLRFDFIAGTYEYEEELELASIRPNIMIRTRDDKWAVKMLDKEKVPFVLFSSETTSGTRGHSAGSFFQTVGVNITLGDSNITLTIKDKSWVGRDYAILPLYTKKDKPFYSATCTDRLRGTVVNEKMQSYMKINKITFVKKEE